MTIPTTLKTLALSLLLGSSLCTQAVAAEVELESKVPGTLSGTLGYASMKYWVEVPGKGNVELLPKEQDEGKLTDLIGKPVTLEGAILTYTDGSYYFEPKFASQPVMPSFTIKQRSEEDLTYDIYFGDWIVRTTDMYQFLSIAHQMDIPGGKVALLELGSGGVGCPTLYQVMVGSNNSPAMVSDEFGTCSDEGKLTTSADGFTLSLPGNPAETWKWDPSLRTVVKQ
ncbi:hypothetical protein N5J40_04385 [Aeromonas caviae]|uniref:hypothetical protein n=1 Tax=Aeromonas caviae TaxID=648 RepID=UPI002448ACE6|nr:hypothetical protein [Aeromonas caviae]MDH1994074.1 hypothetical protein [Aeromonas caviae]